jgi:hypothetical protein
MFRFNRALWGIFALIALIIFSALLTAPTLAQDDPLPGPYAQPIWGLAADRAANSPIEPGLGHYVFNMYPINKVTDGVGYPVLALELWTPIAYGRLSDLSELEDSPGAVSILDTRKYNPNRWTGAPDDLVPLLLIVEDDPELRLAEQRSFTVYGSPSDTAHLWLDSTPYNIQPGLAVDNPNDALSWFSLMGSSDGAPHPDMMLQLDAGTLLDMGIPGLDARWGYLRYPGAEFKLFSAYQPTVRKWTIDGYDAKGQVVWVDRCGEYDGAEYCERLGLRLSAEVARSE